MVGLSDTCLSKPGEQGPRQLQAAQEPCSNAVRAHERSPQGGQRLRSFHSPSRQCGSNLSHHDFATPCRPEPRWLGKRHRTPFFNAPNHTGRRWCMPRQESDVNFEGKLRNLVLAAWIVVMQISSCHVSEPEPPLPLGSCLIDVDCIAPQVCFDKDCKREPGCVTPEECSCLGRCADPSELYCGSDEECPQEFNCRFDDRFCLADRRQPPSESCVGWCISGCFPVITTRLHPDGGCVRFEDSCTPPGFVESTTECN